MEREDLIEKKEDDSTEHVNDYILFDDMAEKYNTLAEYLEYDVQKMKTLDEYTDLVKDLHQL